jgi:SAM-dependent methyltransferase
MFRCPQCHAALAAVDHCAGCGREFAVVEGIPLLVKDRKTVEAAIAGAKAAGRSDWYEAPQDEQWTGPYRHHLRKRRAYLDGVLSAYARTNGRPQAGLDLGCGDGGHLAWLAGHVAELYASDYNLQRLLRARQLGHARGIFMADITDYPMCDDVFDVIFFNHALEHIPDDAAALAEVYRILKPGGLLILGVPNEGAWFWQLAYRLQPETLRTSDHVHFYTADTIAARCHSAGFVARGVEHIGYGVPHWSLDAGLRQFKLMDDALEWIGRIAFPKQASSLYLLLTK